MQQAARTWHLLHISGALDEELATALSEHENVIGWKPERRVLASLLQQHGTERERRSASLSIRSFPLLPGYARQPIASLAQTGPSVSRMLRRVSPDPSRDVLVCTTPYMAPVAEHWPGPVVYWLTDRIANYASAYGVDVPALDRRMCRAAQLICPNSERLKLYLQASAGCHEDQVSVTPNAMRSQNLLTFPATRPAKLPKAIEHRQRPIAGVIGNMGGNIDWPLMLAVVRATPWLTWVFVGPVGDDILERTDLTARQEVQYCRNACFTGAKPYGDLVQYARSFDVAVLPYRLCEPTYSGSSTRFYEHLAACRPMLATHGFAELLGKEPLLRLVDSAQQMVDALDELRRQGFSDGWETLRWKSSRQHTWQVRASSMRRALARRLGGETLPTLYA